jgi:hypothetical protein
VTRLIIEVNFAIHDYRDVFSILQKLHGLFAFPGQLRPSGFGVRILFQAAQFSILETEVYLLQLAFCSLPNGIGFSVKIDGFLFIDQSLFPDNDKGGFKFSRHRKRITQRVSGAGDGIGPGNACGHNP